MEAARGGDTARGGEGRGGQGMQLVPPTTDTMHSSPHPGLTITPGGHPHPTPASPSGTILTTGSALTPGDHSHHRLSPHA